MAASYGYSVILEPQEGGGFTVLVLALPEVVTEGDTQEALANAEEAIRAILEYRREQGMAPPSDAPKDATRTVTVPVHAGRDLRSGTLRSIIPQTGLTVEEFTELL